MLEVGDEFFDGVYHLDFGEGGVGEDGLQFFKEGVDLIHFVFFAHVLVNDVTELVINRKLD